MHNGRHYTEGEIKRVVELWPTHSISEIARMLERNRYSIMYIAKQIRAQGYALPKKQYKDQLINKIYNALKNAGGN